ncbi:hypothetical protein H0N96_02985 [Candidatus Micrarchaeota archaeon]|nr:hypothetical protein [Candidatus Micrarchaeota archaeon]
MFREITEKEFNRHVKDLEEKIEKKIDLKPVHDAWRCHLKEPLEEEHVKELEKKISKFFEDQGLRNHVRPEEFFHKEAETGKFKLGFLFRKTTYL